MGGLLSCRKFLLVDHIKFCILRHHTCRDEWDRSVNKPPVSYVFLLGVSGLLVCLLSIML